MVPSLDTVHMKDVKCMMLFCLCHRNRTCGDMIQCGLCFNWFHQQCVPLTVGNLPNSNETWESKFWDKSFCNSTNNVTVEEDNETEEASVEFAYRPNENSITAQ